MLIEREEARLLTSLRRFNTPVVGDINATKPTSGDVHLYADPTTFPSSTPMLYADCEGLEGSEEDPLARSAYTDGSGQRQRQAIRHKLNWADGKERSKREYAVLHLYPRLLYTFSDVVVFVSKNARYVSEPFLLINGLT